MAGLQDAVRCTSAAAGQLHGGNDHGVEFIHVDDGHRHLGGGLTTRHLGLEEGAKRGGVSGIRVTRNSSSVLYLLKWKV